MSTKGSRAGGKFGGDHTTFIDLAGTMADIACVLPEVTKISAGIIKAGTSGSERRVKISDMSGGVLLTAKQSRSVQEVRIITKNPQATKLAIACAARNMGIPICFGKNSASV